MREPKFSDAPCFGKEFDAGSKVCGICLANRPCQRIVLRALAAGEPRVMAPPTNSRLMRWQNSTVLARQPAPVWRSA